MWGKNCVLLNSVIKIEVWLFLTFSVWSLNQVISLHSIVTYERVQVFESSDSSNRQKNEPLPLSVSLSAKFDLGLSQQRKTSFLRGFILKLTERAQALPKTVGQRLFLW